jgi:hypothetical protein
LMQAPRTRRAQSSGAARKTGARCDWHRTPADTSLSGDF